MYCFQTLDIHCTRTADRRSKTSKDIITHQPKNWNTPPPKKKPTVFTHEDISMIYMNQCTTFTEILHGQQNCNTDTIKSRTIIYRYLIIYTHKFPKKVSKLELPHWFFKCIDVDFVIGFKFWHWTCYLPFWAKWNHSCPAVVVWNWSVLKTPTKVENSNSWQPFLP